MANTAMFQMNNIVLKLITRLRYKKVTTKKAVLFEEPHPMHKTNEHTYSNCQRYSISSHAPLRICGSENNEHQYECEDQLCCKRLVCGDAIRWSCDA